MATSARVVSWPKSARANWPQKDDASVHLKSFVRLRDAGATEDPMTHVRNASSLLDAFWESDDHKDLRLKAKESKFIAGIRTNQLLPEDYGAYMLQDSIYLARSLGNFELVRYNPNNTEMLAAYYNHKVQSYTTYRDNSFKTWRINDVTGDSVRLGRAIIDYLSLERAVTVLHQEHPWLAALACYPCYRLWPELANDLDSEGSVKPPYNSWVQGNKDPTYSSATKLAALVEASMSDEDRKPESKAFKQASQIFRAALQAEVAFFNNFLDEA